MHALIIGMTCSGKTTLAKKLLNKYKESGISTMVLDPLSDPTWNADFQTDNPAEFLQVMTRSRSCALFVDESGQAIGRYAKDMAVIATQSRHFGHKAHFIAQRAVQIDVTMRDQCSELYLFRVGFNDSKTFAEEYGYRELLKACDLAQGTCYKLTRFQKPVLIDVFSR